jgi:hypothetical protein
MYCMWMCANDYLYYMWMHGNDYLYYMWMRGDDPVVEHLPHDALANP